MNSLLMSFPGTPIIYYGDEIGMGDNIYLGDRNGVRTPMQWTPDRNGGFSRCDPTRLYLPMIMDPVYGYEAVNVEAQSRSLASLLSWTKRPDIGSQVEQGIWARIVDLSPPANRSVLVYVRQYENEVVLCVANLSRSAQAAEIDLATWRGRAPLRTARPNELSADRRRSLPGDAWALRILFGSCSASRMHRRSRSRGPGLNSRRSSSPTAGGRCCAAVPNRSSSANVLPAFLASRRWYAERGNPPTTHIVDACQSLAQSPDLGVALLEVRARRETRIICCH
jgi:maltose alpha-D-glucosyltransferase/alpha-amylase